MDSRGISGTELVYRSLVDNGVEFVFGIVGGPVSSIMKEIDRRDEMKLIVNRHEQMCGHSAEGYARVSGKPGVIIVTSGPGATNIVTALADAKADGVALVAITGQVSTSAFGTDAFQSCDIVAITNTCTKWSYQIRSTEEIEFAMNRAFTLAKDGRNGPTLIDIPVNLQLKTIDPDTIPSEDVTQHILRESGLLEYREDVLMFNKHGERSSIEELAGLVNRSTRPLIIAGQGCSRYSSELTSMATRGSIPVTTTLHGLGCFDENHELSLKMLGQYGSKTSNRAAREADLILGIGYRFDDRTSGTDIEKFAPTARRCDALGTGGIVHFDICRKQIGKVITPTIAVYGDCGSAMRRLIPLLDSAERVPERTEWIKMISDWKKSDELFHEGTEDRLDNRLTPREVVRALSRRLSDQDDVYITTGIGNHQMYVAQFLTWTRPGRMVTSGSFGTMGYGLPAAIGVKLAKPSSTVIDIDGDGSLQMTLSDLITLSRYRIAVKIAVFNNAVFGMVDDVVHDLGSNITLVPEVDLRLVCEGCGVRYLRSAARETLAETVDELIRHDGPVLAEFQVLIVDCPRNDELWTRKCGPRLSPVVS